MNFEISVEQYVQMFRKWLWFIIPVAIFFGFLGYLYSSSRPVTYRTSALINVGVSVIQNPDPNAARVTGVIDLAPTYSELMQTYNVRLATVDALDTDVSAFELERKARVRVVPDTSLLTLEISDGDPVVAADLANMMAQQFIINQTRTGTFTAAERAYMDEVNTVIIDLRGQLDEQRESLRELETQLDGELPEEEGQALRDEYRESIQLINSLQTNIHNQVNLIADMDQEQNALQIVETALIPSTPVDHNVPETAIVTTVIGGILAAGFVLVFEFFNNTVNTSQEVQNVLMLPVLGVISRFGGPLRHMPIVGNVVRATVRLDQADNLILKDGISPGVVEEYRTLRTNLITKSIHSGEKIFLVTSPTSGNGKSITAANVAISLADTKRKVLLIDADMRHPQMHALFGLERQPGLTSLLSMRDQNSYSADMLNEYIQETEIPGLHVISAGESFRSPNELLDSENAKQFMQMLETKTDFDIILLDTPPCLVVSDSVALTTYFDIQVLMVVRSGVTLVKEVIRARERFDHLPSDNVSVVLNGVNLAYDDYYSGVRSHYSMARTTKLEKVRPA